MKSVLYLCILLFCITEVIGIPSDRSELMDNLAIGVGFPINNIPIIVYIPPDVYDIYKEHGVELNSKVAIIFKMVEVGLNKSLEKIKSEKYFTITPRIMAPPESINSKVCPNTFGRMSVFLSSIYDSLGGATSFIYITPCPLLELRKREKRSGNANFHISERINGTHKTMNLISIEIEPELLISSLSRAILKACDLLDIEPLRLLTGMDSSKGVSYGLDVREETAREMLLKDYLL